MLKTVSALVIS